MEQHHGQFAGFDLTGAKAAAARARTRLQSRRRRRKRPFVWPTGARYEDVAAPVLRAETVALAAHDRQLRDARLRQW